jgi:hypothetical protein
MELDNEEYQHPILYLRDGRHFRSDRAVCGSRAGCGGNLQS